MRVAVESVRAMMIKVCRRYGAPEDNAGIVVDHYLEGELRGKVTHGVAKFCYESQFFSERRGDPFVARDGGALAVVNGNREIGPLSASFAVDVVTGKAREFGIGLVGLINTQRYGILATWTEELARRGLFGLVMNTSTAESTVIGARTPFLGVNPLSFGVPTATTPLAVDMSTTLAPMGNLWNARRGVATLQADAFVDSEGWLTDDPHDAVSAVVFGGHKGMALSMLVQFVTGSLFGFPMGDQVRSVWETGYAFLAISPAFLGDTDAFRSANSAFRDGMRRLGLRVPGNHSDELRCRALQRGAIDLPDTVYEQLRVLASPESAGENPG